MKVLGVIFNQPVQFGNMVEKHLMGYTKVDERPIAISIDGHNAFVRIDWTQADGTPMANLIPMTSVNSIVIDPVETFKPTKAAR